MAEPGINAVNIPCLACGEPYTEAEVRERIEEWGATVSLCPVKPAQHVIARETGRAHTRLEELHGASFAITFPPWFLA